MTEYLILAFMSTFLAMLAIFLPRSRHIGVIFIWPTIIFAFFMMGFRDETGGDWVPYLYMYNFVEWYPASVALTHSDPGYMLANIISSMFGFGVYGTNAICGLILSAGIYALAKRQYVPALFVASAVPYLIVVVGHGYTRQAAAIGFMMLAIASIFDRKRLISIVYLILAISFHKTAVAFAPVVLFSIFTGKIASVAITASIVPVLYIAYIANSADSLISAYVEAQMSSAGAAMRLIQVFACAILYLLFIRKNEADKIESRLWTSMSLFALIAFPAALFGPSSTMADRLGLYLLPLQMYVLANIGYYTPFKKISQLVGLVVVLINLFLLIYWLNYAVHAVDWLPYQSVLW